MDELWRRFPAHIAVGQFVGRFRYSHDLADMEPVLFQPLLLNLPKPTDEEIVERLEHAMTLKL